MGEIADLTIDGDVGQTCLCELGPGDGYPRSCRACRPKGERKLFALADKAKAICPICGKKVALEGLVQHTNAVHPERKT